MHPIHLRLFNGTKNVVRGHCDLGDLNLTNKQNKQTMACVVGPVEN
jgi:hypothetical protein